MEKDLEGNFVVRVKSPAQEGKANREVEHVLSEYFEVPIRDVTIISGNTSKRKRVSIIDNPRERRVQ